MVGIESQHEKSRSVLAYRAALENEMKIQKQYVSSHAAAQAAALLATPAQPRQHREARRLLRAWQNQQSQPRPVAR